jgi:hypothetical protein
VTHDHRHLFCVWSDEVRRPLPLREVGATPKSEDELAVSLLMSDHHMSVADLESLSQVMMSGEVHPVPDEKCMELLRPAAREAQRILGITPKAAS